MTLRAHAEALYEGMRPLLGEHSPHQVQARLERELRHVIPQWSECLPDGPGWYWFKPPGISEPQLLLVSPADTSAGNPPPWHSAFPDAPDRANAPTPVSPARRAPPHRSLAHSPVRPARCCRPLGCRWVAVAPDAVGPAA